MHFHLKHQQHFLMNILNFFNLLIKIHIYLEINWTNLNIKIIVIWKKNVSLLVELKLFIFLINMITNLTNKTEIFLIWQKVGNTKFLTLLIIPKKSFLLQILEVLKSKNSMIIIIHKWKMLVISCCLKKYSLILLKEMIKWMFMDP